MVQLGLVGGAAFYHARAFSALINGLAPGQTAPESWSQFPQCVEDTHISVVWDEDRTAATELARVYGIEHVVDSLDEVVPLCDGVIVTDDLTREHCRHAPYFLKKGIPTFIDKPLAPNATTAESLVKLAARNNAPLMSSSALRYAAETEEIRGNPNMLGRIGLATAVGPNELFFYGIHPLELAHSVLGGGIAQVQNIGTEEHDLVKLTYGDGRIVMLMVSRAIGFLLELNLYGQEGHRQILVKDATAFYKNQLHLIAQMVRDRQAPVPIENAVEVIRVLEAGKKSFAEGGTIISL
jgi:predicted dehydrogenase